MILSRVIEHVKAQNWTAILIDFVIVVLGVFIGIQVSNWNAARLEAAQQRVYLERLKSDFIGIRERLDKHFNVYGDAIQGGDYLLSIVRMPEDELKQFKVDDAQISRAFDGLTSPRIPPPAPATYTEMVSEGRLSSLDNPALRDALAQYDRLLGVVQEVSRLVADNNVLQGPILRRYFVTRPVSDERSLSGIRVQILSFDVDGMRADRDFAIAVTLLQEDAMNSLEQRKLQMRLIDEILTLIDQEQSR